MTLAAACLLSRLILPPFHGQAGEESGSGSGVVVSNSIGLIQPRAECRRCRLWKPSMYSKIAFAGSTRGRQPRKPEYGEVGCEPAAARAYVQERLTASRR